MSNDLAMTSDTADAESSVTQDSALVDAGPMTDVVGDSLSGGQDVQQGGQSSEKRINNLMSLANKREAERNAALLEIEDLKTQLAEASRYEDTQRPTQQDMMKYGFDGRPPDQPDGPGLDAVETPGFIARTSPPRPDYQQRSPEPQAPDRDSFYLREAKAIAEMKDRLNAMVSSALSD